jgi:predicted N-acetyltransferase YhbS
MEIKLRQENPSDYVEVAKAIIDAYEDVPYSNHKEQNMVARLRESDAFIPQLSILAHDENGIIAGHVLLTKISIKNDNAIYEALALAPLSVRPAYQNKGVGTQLVLESHRVAKSMGYNFIVILGIPDYYPKFGYQLISKYNIKLPIKIGDANALVIALNEEYSEITGGTVIYPNEFFGEKMLSHFLIVIEP